MCELFSVSARIEHFFMIAVVQMKDFPFPQSCLL